jgi:uncharacterized protein YdaU (DUF1376 family)
VANKPPAYQHYAKDWLVGTAHLSLSAQGAYQRLLDHQWEDGALPDDMGTLSRLIGTPKDFGLLWKEIERHFPKGDDGMRRNKRMEEEREKQLAYRELQAKRSAKTRLAIG